MLEEKKGHKMFGYYCVPNVLIHKHMLYHHVGEHLSVTFYKAHSNTTDAVQCAKITIKVL